MSTTRSHATFISHKRLTLTKVNTYGLLYEWKGADSSIFLAHAAGEPAGFTQLYPSFSSVSLARTFVLNDLFVVASQRRTGVGSRLLRAATDHARALGAVRLTLNTDIQNTSAQAVYEARGWKRDREYFVYHFLPQG